MRKAPLILLLFVAVKCHQAFGAEATPEKIHLYLEQCDVTKPDLKKLMKARIIPSEPSDPPLNFASALEKRNAIEAAKNRLKEEERAGLPTPPTLTVPPTAGQFAVGQVGVLDDRVKVLQVIDGKRMLVELTYYSGYAVTNSQTGATRDTNGKCTVLVRALSTEGIADDQSTFLKPVLEVVGTYRYETTDGERRTVMVLEPFDLEAVRKYLRENKPAQSKTKPAPKSKSTK